MSFPPNKLHPDAIRFLTEPRVIASFATTRRDGRPHVASVGYTYDPATALVRIVTKPYSQKVRNVEAGSAGLLNQIDGMLWIQLRGRARVLHDADSLHDAYERFAARYGRVHEGEDLCVVELRVEDCLGPANGWGHIDFDPGAAPRHA